jgi:hypothetical protein
MSRILVCAVAAMLMTAARSLASDSQVERSSLAGLPTLSVVVEELPSVAQTNGLTVALLQADVERRVRQAGISVTPDADAYLYVHVTIADPGASLPVPYFVDVSLMQEVTLPRGIKTRTPLQSPTWSLSRLGLVSANGLRAAVTDRVEMFVDQFIAAFKAVNTK